MSELDLFVHIGHERLILTT